MLALQCVYSGTLAPVQELFSRIGGGGGYPVLYGTLASSCISHAVVVEGATPPKMKTSYLVVFGANGKGPGACDKLF